MTNLQGANDFEQAVVEHIVRKEAPKYIEHLHDMFVDRRENTGGGAYVYFQYLKKPSLACPENKTLGQSVYAEIEGLEGGAGFMLYIDDGKITMLESFSHGSEAWPDRISGFQIKDL